MEVQVINESQNPLPTYAKVGDSGVDIMADFSAGLDTSKFHFADYDNVRKVVLLFPGGRALIPLNLKTAFQVGYEIQIRPRSGLALKHGITVLNTPGTIDSGYRNSWGVILINLGDEVFEIAQGDRIGQAVLQKVNKIEWKEVNELSISDRGTGGFGHTGV